MSSGGEKEKTGWFEAVNADDVKAISAKLQQCPACVNMVDEVSFLSVLHDVSCIKIPDFDSNVYLHKNKPILLHIYVIVFDIFQKLIFAFEVHI